MSFEGSGQSRTKVALFCGGRGSGTIIRAFLRRPEIELTLIVNAYDDGLSTGALRNFIPGMLGPSDFRKNLSYLMDLYSPGKYALREIMEYRLPVDVESAWIFGLKDYAQQGSLKSLAPSLAELFRVLNKITAARVRALLARFFAYEAGASSSFSYGDCSLGNLLFAGAYLEGGQDFNTAAATIGELVEARASLVNVSEGENRVLVALKADGAFLSSEAEVVGVQSPCPIRDLYFLDRYLTDEEKSKLAALSTSEKADALTERSVVPRMSAAASEALNTADIVVLGPGTQHSSLLPSYRIARDGLAGCAAPIKGLVINLEADHDIQGLTASEIVSRVDSFARPDGHSAPIVTHILLDDGANEFRIANGEIVGDRYRDASVIRRAFARPVRPAVHNGGEVVKQLLAALKEDRERRGVRSIEVYVGLSKRSVGASEVREEFVETDWTSVGPASLIVQGEPDDELASKEHASILREPSPRVVFPEVVFFRDWLANRTSQYLVLMTGDGAYRFDDALKAIQFIEKDGRVGAAFGSRTQSRVQFLTSVRAAYGEHPLLYHLAKAAGVTVSIALYLRTGVMFSDPLTGLRIFNRQRLQVASRRLTRDGSPTTPVGITRSLIGCGVEVAELPVTYRTFAGFTDPNWRVRRGIFNLFGLLGGAK